MLTAADKKFRSIGGNFTNFYRSARSVDRVSQEIYSQHAFYISDIKFSGDLSRALKNSEVKEILTIKNRKERVQKAIDYYYENIKFLAQNRHVDFIVCVISEPLYKAIATEERSGEDTLEADEPKYEELNFRRALKARLPIFQVAIPGFQCVLPSWQSIWQLEGSARCHSRRLQAACTNIYCSDG